MDPDVGPERANIMRRKKSQTVLERAASHEQRAFYSNDQMWGKEAVVADSSCVVIQNAAFPS